MPVEFPERFNMADYFLYHNLEEGRENKICLYFKDQTYTYGEAARMSNRTGNALRELGVEMEDRVLIVLPDCPEFVWTWFGAARIGAVITMVNPLLPADDYRYYLEYTRARVAVVHQSLAQPFAEAVSSANYLRAVLVVDDGAAMEEQLVDPRGRVKYFPFAETVESQPDRLPRRRHASRRHRDLAVHFRFDRSSERRGAPATRPAFQHRSLCEAHDGRERKRSDSVRPETLFRIRDGNEPAVSVRRRRRDRFIRGTFDAGKVVRSDRTISADDSDDRADDDQWNAERRRCRVARLSSIRFCYSAGEALPVELYHRWKQTFGVEICDGIGSAEMFHIYITNRPDDVKPGSLGRIVEGYEAKIVDADSNEVPTGEMGTLKIKGDSASLCYWNAHEKSKETFAGDWCTTGDQFHVDAEGYYWYHGRTDDMLKVGGIFVAPAEIENCLLQHDAVLECAVIGHEDGDGLVKPKAFVVAREGHAASDELVDDIKQFAKSRLALYKYPRWVEFVPSLPKNDRGKIDRKLLKSVK